MRAAILRLTRRMTLCIVIPAQAGIHPRAAGATAALTPPNAIALLETWATMSLARHAEFREKQKNFKKV
jgi:hypothetical protein